MADVCKFRVQYVDDLDPFNVVASIKHAEPTVAKKFEFLRNVPLCDQLAAVKKLLRAPHKIEEGVLVALKQEEVTYLDCEATIDELLQDEIIVHDASTVIVLRTKLSIRVHIIIDTLLSSEGRKLRNCLFCLKRMFQDDEELVYEFVGSEGLSCLLKVGQDSEPTFQPYILKAIGEIVVYVDGMNGLMRCPEAIQWLYSLTGSKYRTVAKASLDLLLVFVSYQELPPDQDSPPAEGLRGSAYAFMQAVQSYSARNGQKPWHVVMELLQDKVTGDPEIQAEAMALINRTLGNFTDMDSYYDTVDDIEALDMEGIMKSHTASGKNKDLVKELRAYEASVRQEYDTVYVDADDGSVKKRMQRLKSPGTPISRTSSAKAPIHRSKAHRRSVQSPSAFSNELRVMNSPTAMQTLRSARSASPLVNTSAHVRKKSLDSVLDAEPHSLGTPLTHFRPKSSSDEAEADNEAATVVNIESIKRSLMKDDQFARSPPPSAGGPASSSPTKQSFAFDEVKLRDKSWKERRRSRERPLSAALVETAMSPTSKDAPVFLEKDKTTADVSLADPVVAQQEPKASGSGEVSLKKETNVQLQPAVQSEGNSGAVSNDSRTAAVEQREMVQLTGTQTLQIFHRRRKARETTSDSTPSTTPEPELPPNGGHGDHTAAAVPVPSTGNTAPLVKIHREGGTAVEMPAIAVHVTADDSHQVRVNGIGNKEEEEEEKEEEEELEGKKVEKEVEELQEEVKEGRKNDEAVMERKEEEEEKENKETKKKDAGKDERQGEGLVGASMEGTLRVGSPRLNTQLSGRSVLNDKRMKMLALSLEGTLVDNVPQKIDTGRVVTADEESKEKSPSSDEREEPVEAKLTDSDDSLEWAYAPTKIRRLPLLVNSLDFTDLCDDDDQDPLEIDKPPAATAGGPPPPPPLPGSVPPPPGGPPPPPGGPPPPPGGPPPPPGGPPPPPGGPPPPPGGPPPPPGGPPPPPGGPPPPPGLQGGKAASPESDAKPKVQLRQLYWRKQQLNPRYTKRFGSVWQELAKVEPPREQLIHLFGSVEKEKAKTEVEEKPKVKVITVLDQRRANNILIEISRLPAPRHIKTATLNMDHTHFTKEVVEKLLGYLSPTKDEEDQIRDARAENPNLPLGPAEEFLYTLSTIPELKARLSLWKFRFSFKAFEEEFADAMMDVKCAMSELRTCPTFKYFLACLLAVGNFLNHGKEVEAFHLSFLPKLMDVKDNIKKQPLLHHLVAMVMEKFPDSTDLHSELGGVHRVAKSDFAMHMQSLSKMTQDLSDCWKHLRAIAKYESSTESVSMEVKMKSAQFLSEAAERLQVLQTISVRIQNRFFQMMLYFGVNSSAVKDIGMNELCKIVSDLSLEYRTVHARLLQRKERRKRKTGGLIPFAKSLSKDASSSEQSASPSQREAERRNPASSKQEGRFHRFQHSKKPEKAADLLETLAETAKNSKDDRKSGWRYRRKAQEKRHQKRKSIRRTLGKNDEEQRAIEELTQLLQSPA